MAWRSSARVVAGRRSSTSKQTQATTPRSRSAAICSALSPISRSTASCPHPGAAPGCAVGPACPAAWDHAGHGHVKAVTRALLKQHVARPVVRVGGDVGGGVDLAGRHAGGIQRRQHVLDRAGCCPGADGGVDLGHALHAAGVGGELGSWPRSSRPMAVIRRLKMLSPLPATSTTPSLQGRRCWAQCRAGPSPPARAPRQRRCTRGSGSPSR